MAVPVPAVAAQASVDPAYYTLSATDDFGGFSFCSSDQFFGGCTSTGPTSGSAEVLHLPDGEYSGSAGATVSGATTPGVAATAALSAGQLEDNDEASPVSASANGTLSYYFELTATPGTSNDATAIPVLMNGQYSLSLATGDEDNGTSSTVSLQITGPDNTMLYGLSNGSGGAFSQTLTLSPYVEYAVTLYASASVQVTANEEQDETELAAATIDPVFTIGDAYTNDFQLVFSPDIGNSPPISGSVPEPATWVMMLAGFGLLGAVLRSSRKQWIAAA